MLTGFILNAKSAKKLYKIFIFKTSVSEDNFAEMNILLRIIVLFKLMVLKLEFQDNVNLVYTILLCEDIYTC